MRRYSDLVLSDLGHRPEKSFNRPLGASLISPT